MSDVKMGAAITDKGLRAMRAAKAFERIAELWAENERLIERTKEIHREMEEVMASIPPNPAGTDGVS